MSEVNGKKTKVARCREMVLLLDKKYGGEMTPKELIFKIATDLQLSNVTATNYLYNARRHIDISRGAPVPEWMKVKRKKKAKVEAIEKQPELSEAA